MSMIINITNKEIAEYLDVCPEYISHLKKGKKLSKIRVKMLKEFYKKKLEEIKAFITNH